MVLALLSVFLLDVGSADKPVGGVSQLSNHAIRDGDAAGVHTEVGAPAFRLQSNYCPIDFFREIF